MMSVAQKQQYVNEFVPLGDALLYQVEWHEYREEEAEPLPWDGMTLPAIFQHLTSQGEDPEVAAAIVDGIMVERNGR